MGEGQTTQHYFQPKVSLEGLKWLGPPKMISVSSLREVREQEARSQGESVQAYPVVWGYFTADHTVGARLSSYINPLYFRLHFSMVRCDVGV